ncbi:MAG: type II toxin-antitoxin system PemK/MazF family toxin [Erysipelotrichaceae bacterium]|nr:type II toxin-antitoxin system PemK/MazF family toxin [Erysipelotrichaceae bacterium]
MNNAFFVCPIASTNKPYPFHVELDSSTKTSGSILCDHIISLDIGTRRYTYIESVSEDF